MPARGGSDAAEAAPTGCFKCGRPGHWSRDCPSAAPNSNSSSNRTADKPSPFPPPKFPTQAPSSLKTPTAGKRGPKTRPKLTPDLLLSDDGLGYILRHFPRNFKYHGRGHEAGDLGRLIGLYSQWHSQLLPYFSFDQFVQKVEQVGASKRVRRCIAELKEKVSRGEDPTKLHELSSKTNFEDDMEKELGSDDVDKVPGEDPLIETNNSDTIQEELFDEIYRNTTEEDGTQIPETTVPLPQDGTSKEASLQTPRAEGASTVSPPKQMMMTEEQRARMEANRLKALERLTRSSQQHNVPS